MYIPKAMINYFEGILYVDHTENKAERKITSMDFKYCEIILQFTMEQNAIIMPNSCLPQHLHVFHSATSRLTELHRSYVICLRLPTATLFSPSFMVDLRHVGIRPRGSSLHWLSEMMTG